MAQRALFLDRDGVINVDRGYVHRIGDFVWQDGIFRLVAMAHKAGYPVIVITNQSGIGRGLYSAQDFATLNTWMCAAFAHRGTPLARVYHCPHHPEAIDPEYRSTHPWRKPAPGMLLAAGDDLGLDLARSIMIGDQWTDAEAAARAGVGTIVLVGEQRTPPPEPCPPARRLATVAQAAAWLEEFIAADAAALTRRR